MKYKLDVFTIFIILLIILVLFIIFNKWFSIKESKENFLDFNYDNRDTATTFDNLKIKPYMNTLTHIYDNIYIDPNNGSIFALKGSQTNKDASESTSSITEIMVIPRDCKVNADITYHVNHDSLTIPPRKTSNEIFYDQYNAVVDFDSIPVNTTGGTTYKYQYFYYKWHKNTYIHLFKFDILDNTKKLVYVKSVVFMDTLRVSFDTVSIISGNIPTIQTDIAEKSHNASAPEAPQYLTNRTTNYKLITITNNVTYDISYGNIIIKEGNKIYNRLGSEVNITGTTDGDKETTYKATRYKTGRTAFNVKCQNVMVLVTVYDNTDADTNTIIDVIGYDADKKYTSIRTKRFNRTQEVTNIDSDTANKSKEPTETTPAPTTPAPKDKWSDLYDIFSKDCGNDPTCMYWYFQLMSSGNDSSDASSDVFSDDYFLKSEVVPPVCPQCPNCPRGDGVCTNCGGCGGSGTTSNKLSLTQISSNTYKDKSGNTYISYADNSGNTKYILQGNQSYSTETSTPTETSGKNTVGGTISGNTANVANNLINNTTDIVKDTGSGAVNLLKDTGSGAVNLLRDTGTGAVNLLRDTGSGILNLGSGKQSSSSGQQSSSSGQQSSSSGQQQLSGQKSDSQFGNIKGYTPVDNYSYYGALQSKGGNFMPVTADFSSFRK